ncbi:MAG: universal stress protein, partial [Betaproteobacteria bacterium]|nr:universal stress protein [Betaproteobacteria bacterium]
SRNRGVPAGLQLEPGMAASAIPGYVDAIDADLILLGAHGKGFLQRFLLGSTASRLLRKSKCPVLVVKEPCRTPYRRVLVAVDFSPGSELAVRIAREVAPGADLVLLHVFDVPFEGKLHYAGVSEEVIHKYRIEARERALQRVHGMAKAAELSATDYIALVLHGDATRQIVSQEENYDCDLIVMGKHGTNVTEELLLGSVTKHVLAESRSDVLVVVDKRAPVDDSVPA